eukprot:Rmarinus@m.19205
MRVAVWVVVVCLLGLCGAAKHNQRDNEFTEPVVSDVSDIVEETCQFHEDIVAMSEADACDDMEDIYKRTCIYITDDERTEDKDFFCSAFKNWYEEWCDTEDNNIVRVLLGLCLALSCAIMAGSFVHNIGLHSLPESGVVVLVGILMGVLLWVMDSDTGREFRDAVFFQGLLPLIIFEAGMIVDKGMLLQNIGTIFMFAFPGTMVAVALTALAVYYGGQWMVSEDHQLDSTESILFAALISSIDPIATLAVFAQFGVDRELHIWVFGESMFNDGVAIVAYNALVGFLDNGEELTTGDMAREVGMMVLCCTGSVLIGVFFGLVSAYIFKIAYLAHAPKFETILFILFALIPYYVSEVLSWSGIVSIVVAGIVMDLYTYKNLSQMARRHTRFTIRSLSQLCETTIFTYLGMQIVLSDYEWHFGLIVISLVGITVSRACHVFPIFGLINLTRIISHNSNIPDIASSTGIDDDTPAAAHHRTRTLELVPLRKQFMFWFSGLRGAVSFALAATIPEYDYVTGDGSKHTEEILAMTTAMIMLNIFVFGGGTLHLLDYLGIEMGLEEVDDDEDDRKHDEVIRKLSYVSIDGEWPNEPTGFLSHFHNHYLLPFLVRTHEPVPPEELQESPFVDSGATQLPSKEYQFYFKNEAVADTTGSITLDTDDDALNNRSWPDRFM